MKPQLKIMPKYSFVSIPNTCPLEFSGWKIFVHTKQEADLFQ